MLPVRQSRMQLLLSRLLVLQECLLICVLVQTSIHRLVLPSTAEHNHEALRSSALCKSRQLGIAPLQSDLFQLFSQAKLCSLAPRQSVRSTTILHLRSTHIGCYSHSLLRQLLVRALWCSLKRTSFASRQQAMPVSF
jgi:hypothetical protein